MPIAGSPKRLAQEISEGFLSISAPMLKLYTPADLKIIMANLAIVARELRQAAIPLEDVLALKTRNMKLSRIGQNEMVIRAHCKKRRIPI